MPYSLAEFAADCRAALANDAGPAGREALRQHVMRALKDESFVAEHIPPDADVERKILYEDPELGFCICAHAHQGAKQGKPHIYDVGAIHAPMRDGATRLSRIEGNNTEHGTRTPLEAE